MLEAFLWGGVGASSLVLGAVLGLGLPLSRRALGLFMGVGAGALISGVSFELADEALQAGGAPILAMGLAVGGLAFFLGDRVVDALGRQRQQRPRGADAEASGVTLALGALLDGVPEQAAIGIGLVTGGEVGLALVAAVFLSNLPEALGSAAAMRRSGRSTRQVLVLWVGVAAVCALATVVGYAVLGDASGEARGFILALAAGAVLVMLIDAMVPEAVREGGKLVGLCTVLGFAVAVLISNAGG